MVEATTEVEAAVAEVGVVEVAVGMVAEVEKAEVAKAAEVVAVQMAEGIPWPPPNLGQLSWFDC